jgi:hypothetical protein
MAKTILGGFTPVRKKDNSPNAGGLTRYEIASGYASNIFQGTPVQLVDTGYIQVAAAGQRVLGVAMGFEYVDAQGKVVQAKYFPSGTTAPTGTKIYALVNMANNMLYAIQSDEALDQGDVGGIFTTTTLNGGTVANGRSNVKLDGSSTPADEQAALVRVVGVSGDPENTITDADAVVLVEFVNPGIGAVADIYTAA